MEFVYIIESAYDGGSGPDEWDGRYEDTVYATRELAWAELDRRQAKERAWHDKEVARSRAEYERARAEHEALRAAGLRSGPYREFQPPRFVSRYGIGELILIAEPAVKDP